MDIIGIFRVVSFSDGTQDLSWKSQTKVWIPSLTFTHIAPLPDSKNHHHLTESCPTYHYRQSFNVVAGSPKRINDRITPVEIPLL